MEKESKVSKLELINKLNEIYTPLTNIRLSLDLLETDIGVSETHDFYNIINNNAVKVEAYVRELCSIIADQRYCPDGDPVVQ